MIIQTRSMKLTQINVNINLTITLSKRRIKFLFSTLFIICLLRSLKVLKNIQTII